MRAPLAQAAIALALAGCNLGPDIDMTPPEAAQRFANAPADAPAAWPAPDWWRGFRSPELDRLVAQAGASNRNVRAASFRIVQAEAAARIGAAPLLPTVTLNAGTSRQRSNSVATGGTARAFLRTVYTTSLAATYELDLWQRVRAGASAADTRVLASRYDRDATALSITAQVASEYFNLLGLRDRLALARSNLAASERILGVVETQLRAGTASDLELAQQRTQLAGQRAAIEELMGQERRSLNALAVLLGQRPDQLAIATQSLSQLATPGVPAGIPGELLRRRPDVAKAEADLRAAGFDAQVARAARLPTLTLNASTGFQALDIADFITPERLVWSIAGQLAAPIFNSGRLAATEVQQTARARELAETYAQSLLAAFQDAEDALVTVSATARALNERQAAYAAANQAFQAAEMRWRTGTTDFLSVLQAQQSAVSSYDQLALANAARFAALVSLYRALGGGWQASA